MPKIVISYRRSDMPGMAGRIFDRLRTNYGAEAVFMDVLSNKPGRDFRKQIKKALNQSDVLVAIIGPNWIGGAKRGHSKLTDENDPIRMELETAYELDVPVVPVLVQGARMPTPGLLPPSLRDFSFVHALGVDAERDFHRDIDQLIEAIDELLNPAAPFSAPPRQPVERTKSTAVSAAALLPESPPRPLHRSFFWAIGGAALVGVLGAAFLVSTATTALKTATATLRNAGAPDETASQGTLTLKPIMARTQALRTIAFAPNKSMFAFAGDDGLVRLWDAVTFEPIKPPFAAQHPARILAIAFSGDGKYLFSTGSDHAVHVWDVATGLEARTLEDFPALGETEFHSLAVTSDDGSSASPIRWVKAGAADGGIRTWDLMQKEKSQPMANATGQYSGKVDTLSFAPYDSGRNGKWASAGHGGGITIYSFRDKGQTKLNADSTAILQIKFAKTGDTLASAGYDGVKLWSVGDGAILPAPLRIFDSVHKGYVLRVDWSDDQKWLASGGQDGNVVLWDAQTGSPVHVFGGQDRHTADIEAVAFHPNKKWLLSLSEDKTLKAWDLESKKLLFTLVAYSDGPYLAYTPGGRFTNSSDFHEPLERETNGVSQDISSADRIKLYVPPEKFAQYVGAN